MGFRKVGSDHKQVDTDFKLLSVMLTVYVFTFVWFYKHIQVMGSGYFRICFLLHQKKSLTRVEKGFTV